MTFADQLNPTIVALLRACAETEDLRLDQLREAEVAYWMARQARQALAQMEAQGLDAVTSVQRDS